MPIPIKHQETCPKCGWINTFTITSDCLLAWGGICPKCCTKTKLVTLKANINILHKLKNTFHLYSNDY